MRFQRFLFASSCQLNLYTLTHFFAVILKNHTEELVNGQKFDGQKINRIPQKFVLTTVRKANSYETWTDAPLVVRTCSFKTDFKKSQRSSTLLEGTLHFRKRNNNYDSEIHVLTVFSDISVQSFQSIKVKKCKNDSKIKKT